MSSCGDCIPVIFGAAAKLDDDLDESDEFEFGQNESFESLLYSKD